MDHKFDVVMISGGGRCHWLAQELVAAGLQVALIDVTERLGTWSHEDWEGPFGVFRHGSLTATQVARLEEDARLERVEQGFTLWLPQGPLELQSRLAPYVLERWGLSSESRPYLEQASRYMESAERGLLRKKLLKLPFEQTWLCHMAHQFASHQYGPSSAALAQGEPMALFSDWMIRRTSPGSLESTIKRSTEKGVHVFSKSQILDVGMTNRQIETVEIKGAEAGIVRGRFFVWSLSSEDAQAFPAPIAAKLFPLGVAHSEWAWVRYRVQFGRVPNLAPLPRKFVLIGDLYLPWTHGNFSLFTQGEKGDLWDLWLRLPTQSRFQRGYLEKMGQDVIHILQQRVPGLNPEMREMPAEFSHDVNEVGAPRFPVFNEEQLRTFKTSAFNNFYFVGPEACENLDWSAQFAKQAEVCGRIVEQWKQEREREQRRRKS